MAKSKRAINETRNSHHAFAFADVQIECTSTPTTRAMLPNLRRVIMSVVNTVQYSTFRKPTTAERENQAKTM